MKTQREIYLDSIAEAQEAAEAYYAGTGDSKLTDAQYDTLLIRVSKLGEANSWNEHDSLADAVNAGVVEAGADVTHRVRMLSLDKAQDEQTLQKFIKKFSSEKLLVEPKMDGLAIIAHYNNGKLVQVATRGNSRIGKDVTARAMKATVKGLPHTIAHKAEFEARGEFLFALSDFEQAQEYRKKHGRELFQNPRNAVSGIIQSKSDDRLEGVTITFALYDVVIHDGRGESWAAQTSYTTRLEELGSDFITVSSLMPQFDSADTVEAIVGRFGEVRASFPYPTDGAVIKIDSIVSRELVGEGEKYPRWAIAYKYEEPILETTLRSVTRDVGRTGAISYVANFDSVQFDTNVEKATLNNASFIEDLDLHIGDTILVRKANGIIPEIVTADFSAREGKTLEKYIPPTDCPKCGGELDAESSVIWRCNNIECAKANIIIHAVSRDNLDIRGISTSIITAMVDTELIEDVTDLFTLSAQRISDVVTVTDKGAETVVGDARGQEIYDNIQGAKDVPLDRILSSLGIRHLGRTFGRRFAKHFNSFDAVTSATATHLQEVEGVSSKAFDILEGFQKASTRVAKYRTVGFKNLTQEAKALASNALAGENVVVTGGVPGYSRDQVKGLIEDNGGTASGSVTGKTTLLVAPADERDTSKAKKAIAQGTPIVTPEEFLTKIGK